MKKIKLFGYMVLLSLFFVAGYSNQATKKKPALVIILRIATYWNPPLLQLS